MGSRRLAGEVMTRLFSPALTVPRTSVLVLTIAAWCLAPRVAGAQVVRPDLPVTDGPVHAISIGSGALYIGGEFHLVGPSTGSGVPLDGVTGRPRDGFPRIDGTVYAVAADGAGGWYIGGSFTTVGDTPRFNLAHVLADDSVAPWAPDLDGAVTTLAESGGTVYVGGSFGTLGSQPRARLGAVDGTTGFATPWDPAPDDEVRYLVVSGSKVYAGGSFTTIGGQSRNRLAALDATTGLATAWDPAPDGEVLALAADASTVYVGGAFAHIGGQARNYVAALDTVGGSATSWAPTLYGDPPSSGRISLAVGDTSVFVGGEFYQFADTLMIHGLVGFGKSTAQLIPRQFGGVEASALALDGSTLFAAGSDRAPYGNLVEAMDAVTGASAGWDLRFDGEVAALAASGSRLFVGGGFDMIGKRRNLLAAIDVATGTVTDWDPDLEGRSVRTLALSGSSVYAGGEFSRVGVHILVPADTVQHGWLRANAAAFDAASALPTAWAPEALLEHAGIPSLYSGYYASVAALAMSGSTVYAAGRFSRIGGQPRSCIAALDAISGAATAWNPMANDSISTLLLDEGTVFVAGNFDRIGGATRNGAAALSTAAHDSTDGVLMSWDPNPSPPPTRSGRNHYGQALFGFAPVRALAKRGEVVYAGGAFTSIGGQGRDGLAALDATTGLATSWAPVLSPSKQALELAASDATVYLGGGPASGAGQLVALDAQTGAATIWDPAPDGYVDVLALSGTTVYAGGGFMRMGTHLQAHLTAVGDLTTPVLVSLLGAETEPDVVRLAWAVGIDAWSRAVVQRSTTPGEWVPIGDAVGDGGGRVRFEDRDVRPGARYGYRLEVIAGGERTIAGEVWVDVPRAPRLALEGLCPNPAPGHAAVMFDVASPGPVRLEVLDVSGRRVLALEVAVTKAGRQVVGLGGSRALSPGIYVIRLTQGDRSLTRRGVVLR
jgi:trimeric autotransporter adhesin